MNLNIADESPASGSGAIRALGPLEEFFWRSGLTWPITIYLTAFVEYSGAQVNWSEGVRSVQRKYEHLRVTVQKEPGGRPFFVRSTAELPLTVLPWEQRGVSAPPKFVADATLGYTHPLLAHVLVFEGLGFAQITLVINHCVIDGLGAVSIMQDLLAACVGEPLPGSVPIADSVNALFDSSCAAAYEPRRNHPPLPRILGQASPHISSAVLGKRSLPRLRAAVRQHGTTVQGALVAAFFAAARQSGDEWAVRTLVSLSPINLRPMLRPQKSTPHGVLIGVHSTVSEGHDHPDFWNFARAVHADIQASCQLQALQGSLRQACAIVCEDGTPDDPSSIDPMNLLAHDLMVSNYGAPSVRSEYARLHMTGLFPAVTGGPDSGTQTISLITFDGVMCFTHISPSPLPRLLETALTLLEEAAVP